MNKIAIPIKSDIIGELFLRSGLKIDVSGLIEDIIMDYLERTEGDDGWKEEYYEYIEKQREHEDFGDPREGYQWKQLYLPNGTKIYMTFNQKKHCALIKHGEFHFNDKTDSPAQFANSVAGHSRNAWRDLYVKRPKDTEWVLADRLR